MTPRRNARTLIVLAAMCAAVPVLAADADETRFALSGHYQLRLNDKLEKDVKFYQAVGGIPKLVIVVPGLPHAVLVTAGEKKASSIDASRVQPVPDAPDTISILPSPVAPQSSALTIDGTKLRFAIGPSKMVVEPRDPLLGEVSPDEIMAYMPEWRRNTASYTPGIGDLRLLDTLRTPTEVDVFFGSWCPHCEQLVPRLIRVMQQLKTPNLKIHFHGVPIKMDEDPLVRQYKITAVPLGVIRRGDQRIADIEGPNWEKPESALSALLFGTDSIADNPS